MGGGTALSIWDRLEDPNNPRAAKWLQLFNQYNASIGNALGKLREQPQSIQGRDTEIKMLHAILERPKTPVALLLGPAGVGKALDDDTLIPSPDNKAVDGYLRMGDIAIGDLVYDENGKPTEVLGVYPQGECDAYAVAFADGSEIVCNDGHIWKVWDCVNDRGEMNYQDLTLREIMDRGVTAKNGDGNLRRWATPKNGAVEREPADLPIDPYALGVLIGSGHLNEKNTLQVYSKDIDSVQRVAEGLEAGGFGKYARGSDLWYFRKGDNHVFGDKHIQIYELEGQLHGERVFYTNQVNRRIPKRYLCGSIEQRYDLLHGLMDTKRGSCTPSGQVQLRTRGVELAHDVAELCRSLGIRVRVTVAKGGGTTSALVNFLLKPEDRENMFWTKAKREKIRLIVENLGKTKRRYGDVPIVSVKKIDGKRSMTCIYVASEEHTFLAGREHIVTHNTAIVEEFAKQLNSGTYETYTKTKYLLIALRLGQLSALGTSALQSALSTLLDRLKDFEDSAQAVLGDPNIRIVLFIDEVHMLVTIFGPGTKVGGDVLKDTLARSPIRVIAATTRREYDSTIAVDKPLAERFKQIEISELNPDIVADIVHEWWAKVVPTCPPLDDKLVRDVIEVNRMYRSDSAEPRKTIDIVEDLASYCLRTNKPATSEEVDRIFRDRYSISLSFKVDADDVYAEIDKRIKGQPFAKYELKRLVRSLVYQLDLTSNKPRLTTLFTGPTGVGKALDNDTLIPVADNRHFVRMGDLKVGDKVYDEFGEPTDVIGVYPQGQRDVYEVTFDGDRKIICDGDHIWSCYEYDRGSRSYLDGLKEFTTNEMLEKGILTECISRKHPFGRFCIPLGQGVNAPDIDLPMDPYALGALLGDGCVGGSDGQQVILTNRDEYIAERVARGLGAEGFVKHKNGSSFNYVFQKETYCDETKRTSKYVLQRDLNVVPELRHRSYGKSVPEIYKYASRNQIINLLQGLFDTDGSVGVNKYSARLSFSSSSKQLILDVHELLARIGIKSRLENPNHPQETKIQGVKLPSYGLRVIADDEVKLELISVPRKRDRIRACITRSHADGIKKRNMHRDKLEIIDVKKLPKKRDTTCILVSSHRHLFIAGRDYVVTHNTETTKAIADSLYPGESVILNINCPDFKTAEHEAAFRRRLGEYVRHTPNAIVLLDEFEKAHESVRDSMLAILDEGIVNFETMNREGYIESNHVSLRNTIIIATTNAGSDVFENDARFSQRNTRLVDEMNSVTAEEVRQLMATLEPNLMANGFKPEMLGRFSRIIPYRSLTADTLIHIAQREIDDLVKKFHDVQGITILTTPPHQWPKEAYDYVTTDLALYIAFIRCDAANSKAGGARAIRREIQSSLYDTIIDAIVDNPGCTKFRMYVSEKAPIYEYGAALSEGGIIVEPVTDEVNIWPKWVQERSTMV